MMLLTEVETLIDFEETTANDEETSGATELA